MSHLKKGRPMGLALWALAVGCSSSSGGLPAGTVTQTVGKQGADITVEQSNPTIAGTELLIPAGALSQDTTITVGSGADQALAGETSVGPSVRFQPDGLTFAMPATLTLPFKLAQVPAGSVYAVAVTSMSGRSEIPQSALTVDANAGKVTLQISHFTDYQIITIPQNNGTDGGTNDGGVHDGGLQDSGTVDMTTVDGSNTDGGISDGGLSDGSIHDGGSPIDYGVHDGGIYDAL